MPGTLAEALEGVVVEFRYPDAKSFREFVEALSKILDEARFDVTSDGIRVVGMDPAKIAYMEVSIPSSILELEFKEDRDVVYMGVNLETFASILKKGKKGEPLLFRVADDKIYVEIESVVVKRFLIPNIEVIIDAPERIELEHSVEATVISDVIKKAIKDIEIVGDVVEIQADEDRLIFRAKGGEGRAKVETVLQRDISTALLFLEVAEPSTSLYDVSYLKNVLNLTRVADSVDIKFSSGKPLEMVFKTPEGSQVRYILAPSVA